ncbi:alpha/beta hydrolase [uncultured Parasphingopyxis sp.]|uniref:alpha/beta fold hydrolase n=1 Tax=uncultured Parasphingopyxis sp. TaxID=1547918 RepID=UPI0026293EBC|nr:alpha/beta hydrolase [uncultured Parasphingopyxis sp.]
MQLIANNIAIEAEDHGDPADPAILLIMGFGAQLLLWPDELVEALVAKGFRVVRFDNRDIGLSHKFEGEKAPHPLWHLFSKKVLRREKMAPYTLEDMADDAIGVLDALGIERAHVMGASMGGMIAQIVGANYPDRVLSLIPVMTSTNNPKLPGPKKEIRAMLFRAARNRPTDKEEAVAAGTDFFTAIGGSAGSERQEIKQLARQIVERSFYPEGPPRQMAAIIDTGDLRPWTRRITAPTLVIHGADDPLILPAGGEDVARNIEGAQLEVIEGMGHDLPPSLIPKMAEIVATHCRAHGPAAGEKSAA